MKKLFVLFLILFINIISSKAGDTLRVYSWKEAMATNPESVYVISLERMKLKEVPAELIKFKNLKKLDLSKNNITSLPDFMGDFDSLQELNLHKNELNTFPVQLCKMKSIRKLILTRNLFISIPECIEYMKGLTYLDISDTPVAVFPEAFVDMPQLQTLVLHGLAYNRAFQSRWRERLPWMRIEFDVPCHCME